jgi:hypothetical protein
MAQALRVASGSNILKWKIGDFTVTSIPESEAKTTPKFLFKEVDKKALSKIADEHTWLKPNYVSPDGLMMQKVQASPQVQQDASERTIYRFGSGTGADCRQWDGQDGGRHLRGLRKSLLPAKTNSVFPP